VTCSNLFVAVHNQELTAQDLSSVCTKLASCPHLSVLVPASMCRQGGCVAPRTVSMSCR
jgi:hypothetical protein